MGRLCALRMFKRIEMTRVTYSDACNKASGALMFAISKSKRVGAWFCFYLSVYVILECTESVFTYKCSRCVEVDTIVVIFIALFSCTLE